MSGVAAGQGSSELTGRGVKLQALGEACRYQVSEFRVLHKRQATVPRASAAYHRRRAAATLLPATSDARSRRTSHNQPKQTKKRKGRHRGSKTQTTTARHRSCHGNLSADLFGPLMDSEIRLQQKVATREPKLPASMTCSNQASRRSDICFQA